MSLPRNFTTRVLTIPYENGAKKNEKTKEEKYTQTLYALYHNTSAVQIQVLDRLKLILSKYYYLILNAEAEELCNKF